ncbi:hypothetical protein [Halioxenophilus sp. WMMB6]|uniref:hypothetical protein n=1 Tax=Halioxenophilus sp. WMMB6 TaxID=3073815 RepID=UPI00295F52D5|nr:hypothetical protein [Halioxenophilus sp. WMMB6]
MDINYPGINIKVELSVIGEYLNEMESGINAVCNSYLEREEKENEGVPHYEYQHIYSIAEQEIPRIIKMPFVVTLYTLFENSVFELLRYGQNKEHKKIGVKDIRGKSLISSYNKYIQHILEYKFCFDQGVMSEFSQVTKVRNCIAHSNGNIESMNDSLKNDLVKLIEMDIGLSQINSQLDVSYDYLVKTYNFVSSSIRELMEYMEERYFENT